MGNKCLPGCRTQRLDFSSFFSDLQRPSTMPRPFETATQAVFHSRPSAGAARRPIAADGHHHHVVLQANHAIPSELWDWTVSSGSHNVPIAKDTRESVALPTRTMKDLLDAAPTERGAACAPTALGQAIVLQQKRPAGDRRFAVFLVAASAYSICASSHFG